MPRHNYAKITDEVDALCAKHGVPYETKSLIGAFAAIVDSLRDSGTLWKDTYEEAHGKKA
jgi:acyl-CoA (8-3)-desaturase (Delta-5 desaturase)